MQIVPKNHLRMINYVCKFIFYGFKVNKAFQSSNNTMLVLLYDH